MVETDVVRQPARLAAAPAQRRSPALASMAARARGVLWFVLVIVVMAGLWEGYKALGQALGDTIPGTSLRLPVTTDDLSMPHLRDIVAALVQPARRGADQPLGIYLLTEATVTLREAGYGLLAGAAIGFALAVLLAELRTVQHGLLPWLVASQTVPLVAVAPMIVIWGGKAGLPGWVAVTAISGYLAFFPVTVNTLRGLQSPPAVQADVMRVAAAGRGQTLWWLRLPAALPYLFAGLRLAATASVVGAIVGELSAGTGRGIGRAILTFTYYYANGPEKLYAAVVVAAVCGIAFVQALYLIESVALRHRRVNKEDL